MYYVLYVLCTRYYVLCCDYFNTYLAISKFCQESFLGFELSCTKPGKTQANRGQDTIALQTHLPLMCIKSLLKNSEALLGKVD
jgi:hypothetical protein